MHKIRILIVDDAVAIRWLVSNTLASDPALEVAGTAANGRTALAMIPQVNPDLVTLDVEMPEMDGLQTLAAIRKTYPRLPVIMFSSFTERGAGVTLDALALGANDYVTKPANLGSLSAAIQCLHQDLIPKIKAFCTETVGNETLYPTSSLARVWPRPTTARLVEIVTIGVSTGGPKALATFLPQLPADFPVPIVIVQHMPPLFTKLLAQRLAARSAIHISEGVAGATLRPGQAWIAPGDYHMALRHEANAVRVHLHQGPPENSCRPAVDVLFRSVAETYGSHTLAIVLTGMGQDGLRGCEYIRRAGGQVLVQDQASSVVWSMPGLVAKAGLADKVLALDQFGAEIVHRVQEGRSASITARAQAAK
jgi:two-component system chemotaxis response regulator CheB